MNLKHWTLLSIVCMAMSRQLAAAEPLQPARLTKKTSRHLPTPPQKAALSKSGIGEMAAASRHKRTNSTVTPPRVAALRKDTPSHLPRPTRHITQGLQLPTTPTPVRRHKTKTDTTAGPRDATSVLLAPQTEKPALVKTSATPTAPQITAVVAVSQRTIETQTDTKERTTIV